MGEYRDNPYSQFNFLVSLGDIDPGQVRAGFTEVSGLELSVETIEYRNGNEATNAVRKMPGMTKYGNVTLKRGVIGSTDLFDWIREARDGSPEVRRTVVIQLLSEDRQSTAQTWTLRNALPMKYVGPTLSAQANEVAMEELVLACEGLELE